MFGLTQQEIADAVQDARELSLMTYADALEQGHPEALQALAKTNSALKQAGKSKAAASGK
jgi:hypothetical protein